MIVPHSSDGAAKGVGHQADDFKGALAAERALLAAAWRNPEEFGHVANACGLCVDDFIDRLHGMSVAAVQTAVGLGNKPSLIATADLLTDHGVPNAIDELYSILVDTPVPGDVAMVDLVQIVQRAADERADSLLRELAQDGFKRLMHALHCECCGRAARREPVHRRGTRKRREMRRPATYV